MKCFNFYLDFTIHASRQEHVGRFWEPTNALNAFCVSGPRVNLFFGNETFVWRRLVVQINAHVVRRLHK